MTHATLTNRTISNGNQSAGTVVGGSNSTTVQLATVVAEQVVKPAVASLVIPSVCSSLGPAAGWCASGIEWGISKLIP